MILSHTAYTDSLFKALAGPQAYPLPAWRISHIEWRILHIKYPAIGLKLTYVQRESILRCQCDIAARLHHDRAARSNRHRCADRDPLLRHLSLRPPSGPQRVEWSDAHRLSL